MGMKRLTIFTPTYNRAYILPQLYDSLCEQTCQDFEWLIVDDGSTDNTWELIEKWMHEERVEIRYFFQENSGKMMAHNKAVQDSKSELFMWVDSDDYLCSAQVVGEVISYWDCHNKESKDDICGIIAYK